MPRFMCVCVCVCVCVGWLKKIPNKFRYNYTISLALICIFLFGDNSATQHNHRVDPLSYFSFQPVLHDWCNKGRGMYYPVCGMVHIKGPVLLIDKSSLCGGSGFPFSLSEWSLTICLMPYNPR